MAETVTPVQATAQPAQPVVPATPAQAEPATAPTVQPAQPTTEPVVDRTTEQFEKLKESNKKLFDANRLLQEELARRARAEQTFAPIQQAQPQEAPTTPAPSLEQFVTVDPTTGEQYVDDKKLSAALTDAQQRATRAEVAVQNYIRQQQALDEEKQTVEAYESHPEVNPTSPKFDAKVSDLTAALLLHSMMNPQSYGGRQLTFKEAADRARGLTPQQAQVVEQANQQAQATLETKQQVTAEATGVSTGVAQQAASVQTDDLNVLIDKTRRGRGDEVAWAIAKRLSRVPHTGTPTSST